MAEACVLCGLRFERAQGYFVGAIYVNYAVTAVLALGLFFLLWGLTALSTAAELALVVPLVIVFPLWFFRYSRSLLARARVADQSRAVRRPRLIATASLAVLRWRRRWRPTRRSR